MGENGSSRESLWSRDELSEGRQEGEGAGGCHEGKGMFGGRKGAGGAKQRGEWLEGEAEIWEMDALPGRERIEGLAICVDSGTAGMFTEYEEVRKSLFIMRGSPE